MKILHTRAIPDRAISAASMIRPDRRSGELLACELLAPAFQRGFWARYATDPTPNMERATHEFGQRSAAPVLCGYAVRAVATPSLALWAMREPDGRGRAMIAAAIDCLGGGDD